MCGFIAFFSKNNQISLEKKKLLLEATELLSHRGPDTLQSHQDKNFFLGHTRLSIIDLSTNANQPFKDNDYICVYNGEIFNFLELKHDLKLLNHNFKTSCDTEVILKAYQEWGIECTKRFNGMFSFVIYNLKTKNLIACRDRFGEKPLYYYNDNNYLIFSSEIKSILKLKFLNLKLDQRSVADLFTNGYTSSGTSIIKNIKKLEPGYILSFHNNFELKSKKCFWKIPELVENNRSVDDLEEEFEELIYKSVKLRLISDVKHGILLSGGIDSSIIAYYAKKLDSNIKSYTFTNDNYRNYNEKKYAMQIAKNFKINQQFLDVKNVDFAKFFKTFHKQFDEPIFDSSLLPSYFIFKEAKKFCKVLLTGDGGDELFGGYQRYPYLKISSIIKKILINKNYDLNLEKNFPFFNNKSKWISTLFQNNYASAINSNQIFSKYEIQKLLGLNYDTLKSLNFEIKYDKNDIIDIATRIDFLNYLPNDINSKIDISSMSNGVEARAPFLDYNLVEFVFKNLKSNLRTSFFDKKIFLKKISRKYFPKDYNFRRKQGFSIDINQIFKNNIQDVKDVIFESDFYQNKKENENLIKKFVSGVPCGEKIFGMYYFEKWRNYHGL